MCRVCCQSICNELPKWQSLRGWRRNSADKRRYYRTSSRHIYSLVQGPKFYWESRAMVRYRPLAAVLSIAGLAGLAVVALPGKAEAWWCCRVGIGWHRVASGGGRAAGLCPAASLLSAAARLLSAAATRLGATALAGQCLVAWALGLRNFVAHPERCRNSASR